MFLEDLNYRNQTCIRAYYYDTRIMETTCLGSKSEMPVLKVLNIPQTMVVLE